MAEECHPEKGRAGRDLSPACDARCRAEDKMFVCSAAHSRQDVGLYHDWWSSANCRSSAPRNVDRCRELRRQRPQRSGTGRFHTRGVLCHTSTSHSRRSVPRPTLGRRTDEVHRCSDIQPMHQSCSRLRLRKTAIFAALGEVILLLSVKARAGLKTKE